MFKKQLFRFSPGAEIELPFFLLYNVHKTRDDNGRNQAGGVHGNESLCG